MSSWWLRSRIEWPSLGVDHELVLGAEVTQCPVEVHGLPEGNVGVLGAVQDEHRGADAAGEGDRAERVMRVWTDAVPAGAAAERGLELAVLPGRGEHPPVGDAGVDQRGAKPVGLPDGPGGHEAAVAPAGDAQPIGVGDALGDEQVDAGQDVGPFLPADPARDAGGEGVTVALAAARVGQEHGVASGGQPLCAGEPEQLEAIGVAVVGAAVHERDERERAVRRGFPGRQYEQTVQIEAVGGTVGQRSLGTEGDAVQFRASVRDLPQRPGWWPDVNVRGLVTSARQYRDHRASRGGGEGVEAAGVLRQWHGTVGVEPGQGRVQSVGEYHQRSGFGLAQFGGAHRQVGGAVAADAAAQGQVEHRGAGLEDRWGKGDVTEVPTLLVRPPGQRACLGLDRSEVLRDPRCGVEQVQSAGAGTVVQVGTGPGEHGERATVGSLPQFHDMPVAEHVRGGDLSCAQVEQAQPGTRFALTDDNGVVAVPGAVRLLFGGLVLG
jgi:hypothetical protein